MRKGRLIRITSAVIAWLLTVCWGYFIFSMSSEDSSESSETSNKVVENIAGIIVPGYDKLPESERNEIKDKMSFPIRKLAHFSEFAIMGGLLIMSLKLTFDNKFFLRVYIICSMVMGSAYAVTDEWHQASVPGRSPQITDVMIDISGVICGIAGVAFIIYLVEKKRRRLTT